MNRDKALSPLVELILELTDIEGHAHREGLGFGLSISSISVDLPMELDVYQDSVQEEPLRLGVGPPAYQMETSFTTVFHRMRLTITPQYGEK
ncbi:MAG: hypothetical protein KDC66_17330 [Phaeodactylibacter sp.]|nr:hypothetical protein [Phaeodactylibacter sp.]MCB9273723.1 hypothetical protein [Lewinellaceae bacterium]